MMKNYFESEKVIVSFEKALYVLIDEKNRLFVCVEKGLLLEFPIGNWNFYKAWLDAKGDILEKKLPRIEVISISEKDIKESYLIDFLEKENNKANNSNRIPDVGKMVLSRDILQTIVDKADCRYCTVDHLSQDCKNCYSYSNIKISDEFVKEINEMINEV